MRAWLVAIVVVVAACKGGKDKTSPGQAAAAKAALAIPKVEVATVLAKEDGKPPFLLLVDDKGDMRLAAAATWADLDANKLKVAKKVAPLDATDRFVRERFAFGKEPLPSIADWDEFSESDPIDLAALEDTSTRSNNLTQDDPPPPEEEDRPDDGADESGGTGTAMALEEGKLGKTDSDRAEGQYRMKKNVEDPQLARQQAIEQARAAGIVGSVKSSSSLYPGQPSEDGMPSRVAQVTGAVTDGKFERMSTMIFVSPTTKATKLIELVAHTQGAIAVSHGGKIRPLRIDFGVRDSWNSERHYWLEARVTANGITIEAVPDKPIEITDLKELAAAVQRARETRDAEADSLVDVLVEPSIDSQRLIDTLVALDTAGVRAIGMGAMPSPEELARRGRRIPTTWIGQPSAQGDLDKREIRKVVKASKPKIDACYAKALESNPTLSGTVSTQFFITPKGTVASAAAIGVDPELANCISGVVKALVFPKPAGGGGVQVNYPFTMRP